MPSAEIARHRLASQYLAEARLSDPESLTKALCGIQAQDYVGAKWAIGLRLHRATDADIERAIANRRIVRTWAMRGTLHFVAATDIHWLLAALAPRIIAGNAHRYRQLCLDENVFGKSNQVIGEALLGGKQLTRSEVVEELAAAGISAEGQRAPYLLQRAALAGIICHGLNRENQPTYTSLQEWVQAERPAGEDVGLVELARRYFYSHGPATLQDFVWWSGLSSAAARTALAVAGSKLKRVGEYGKEFWSEAESRSSDRTPAHFLPPFDEYLLGYRDRTAVVKAEDTKKINAGGGMPKPTVVVAGEVVGTWRRSVKADRLQIVVEPFRELTDEEIASLKTAATRLGAFWGKEVNVQCRE